MQKRIIMCVLVYPKDETQKTVLTSFLEEKNIDFYYNISDSETSNEYLQVLLKRANEITENPEQAGRAFDEFDKKMRARYGC